MRHCRQQASPESLATLIVGDMVSHRTANRVYEFASPEEAQAVLGILKTKIPELVVNKDENPT